MKEKQFENWKKIRDKGMRRFLLVNGLLSWGVPMFVVMTFIVNKPDEGYMPIGLIVVNAIIWALGGLGFGYFTWMFSEKSFQKELEKQENA